ncbi:MarR family winged helix-turn-helix transcriptional regulator [Flexivirga caeni]|uniref:MarR family transcriptional regulator n=1 Tax=Flexivirga caeni TaxID=2294115 RepID=A0A3M9MEI2_9MICO|nr:MarR family transcriptional regulator [Flexivirga caeni]RNI23894.1 MarR family transcriptional regulator [Flexivirga caeni]
MTSKPTNQKAEVSSALLDVPAFALSRLGRLAHATVHDAFAGGGLSSRTYFVLRCLHEDGQMSQRELADRVSMDRSDLVKLLDQLENVGHLRRGPDPRDRRRHLLSITPRGVTIVEQGRRLLDQANEEVFASLNPNERATLHHLVRRALHALA